MRCTGFIQGDPDIAGTGVVVAIWANNGLALLAGWTLWILQSFYHLNAHKSKPFRIALKCGYMLGDTANVASLAIIISSIILIRRSEDTSLYHIFVARCLSFNTMAVMGTALYYDVDHRVIWKLRMGITTVTIALHMYWTWIGLGEFHKWSGTTPKCFHNDDPLFPDSWYTDWMYLDLVWTPVGWVWYVLDAVSSGPVQSGLEAVLQSVNQWVPRIALRVREIGTELYRTVARSGQSVGRPMSYVVVVGDFVVKLIFGVAEIVGRVLVAIPIFIFVGPPSTVMLSTTVYWMWSIWDLTMVWSANSHIVVACPSTHSGQSLQGHVNPENDLGFGQLFPLIMLLLPILNLIDNMTE